MQLTPEQIREIGPEALQKIRAELAKRSLLEFTRQAWPILEPGVKMKEGWVLEAICEHLEAVADGRIKRLLINVPPGSSKSRLARVMFPLWLWTNRPWMRVIGASYALALSERDSYYARTVIQSDWYQRNFGVSISSEMGARVNFDNTSMGGMRAISVGGATTGFRGDLLLCFPGDAVVATERGDMPIKEVVEKSDPNLRVWSLDAKKGEMVLEAPSRWMKNPGDDIYEVGFSDGTKMRCTGDHKVLTLGGWKAAASLTARDTLPRLVEGRPVENVLGPVSPRRSSANSVNLSFGNTELLGNTPTGPVTHHGNLTSSGSVDLGFSTSLESSMTLRVSDVFGSSPVSKISKIVVPRVPIEMSDVMIFGTRANKGEHDHVVRPHHFGLAANPDIASKIAFPVIAQLHKFLGHVVRKMCSSFWMFSPHSLGFRPDEAGVGNGIPVVGSGYKTPLYVRHVGHEDSTYCLTVEHTSNFVCENTIVSNCDDAHNISDGESDAKRSEAVQWFNETFQTRVNDLDNTPIVVIGQRVHEEDVYSAALDLGYEHLNIPMEWEEEQRKTTGIGWTDPRTKEGDLMWPERFSADAIERLKKALGPYAASAQLQQRPVPRKGGMFQVDNVRQIEDLPDENFIAVRAWDLAGSEGKGAYTVGTKMLYGEKSQQFYVVDIIRKQLGGGAVRQLIEKTAEEDGLATKIIIPQDPGAAGKVVVQDIIALLAGYNAKSEPQSGSKETRAEPLASQIEIGKVSVLKRVWTKAWMDELRFFPKGKFKDQVDATASAFNALSVLTRKKRKTPQLSVVGERQDNLHKIA